MTKFILLYNGPATDMDDMTDEQKQETMMKWKTWMDDAGESITDIGSPMANGVAVVDDGSDGSVSPLSGYTVIEAVDIDEAKDIVDGHPFLSDGEGRFSVEIHELMPVPMPEPEED